MATPIAHRLRPRGQTTGLESGMRNLSVYSTPTRGSTRQATNFQPTTPQQGSYGTPDVFTDTPSPYQPMSAGPEELHNAIYPPTKNERIVDTALVLLLNVLTMYRSLQVNWTMHRFALKAGEPPGTSTTRENPRSSLRLNQCADRISRWQSACRKALKWWRGLRSTPIVGALVTCKLFLLLFLSLISRTAA
jgi:hypothetical protein